MRALQIRCYATFRRSFKRLRRFQDDDAFALDQDDEMFALDNDVSEFTFTGFFCIIFVLFDHKTPHQRGVMFQKQLAALRQAIALATNLSSGLRYLEGKEEAFTNIIEEKLKTPKKTYSVAAILFLENHEITKVYAGRAAVYKKLGDHALTNKDLDDALDYFERAAEDLEKATEFAPDLSETYHYRRELSGMNALIAATKEKISLHASEPRDSENEVNEDIDEDDDTEASSPLPSPRGNGHSSYALRSARMWNPKREYDAERDRMDAEQKGLIKKQRR